ncbi:hypothetical protein LASUN_10370 [Lentilactobacillus sunkii]|uniref:Uncharacterized protein n=1 Tax=Lentilactobacillus sunkii TaxID=481719 RepID=A0A1E7XEI2_9LACO|nr:hypothetical protein [Lentilactobacillus sunkii]OFA11428.1 hypothetical protein LASUN_10370 [Lentilactobacillus sunkii]
MKFQKIVISIIAVVLFVTLGFSVPSTATAAGKMYSFPSWTRGHWHSAHYYVRITRSRMSIKKKHSSYKRVFTHPRYYNYGYAAQNVKIYNTTFGKWKTISFVREGYNKITYTYHIWTGNPITLRRGW